MLTFFYSWEWLNKQTYPSSFVNTSDTVDTIMKPSVVCCSSPVLISWRLNWLENELLPLELCSHPEIPINGTMVTTRIIPSALIIALFPLAAGWPHFGGTPIGIYGYYSAIDREMATLDWPCCCLYRSTLSRMWLCQYTGPSPHCCHCWSTDLTVLGYQPPSSACSSELECKRGQCWEICDCSKCPVNRWRCRETPPPPLTVLGGGVQKV